jgi:hypothetical protein
VRRAILDTPGVEAVLIGRDLDPRHPPQDAIARAAALNEYPARTGDLILIPRANWIFVSDDGTRNPGSATTHGTLRPYDARVPVVLFGAGIRSGQYDVAASPIDIAPTLARLCGVSLPTATGRVLDVALTPTATTASSAPRDP